MLHKISNEGYVGGAGQQWQIVKFLRGKATMKNVKMKHQQKNDLILRFEISTVFFIF